MNSNKTDNIEIELESIRLHENKTSVSSLPKDNGLEEEDIETIYGSVNVIVQGDRSKPAIMTYHDIGLNSVTCFQAFFNYPEMQPLLKHFCIYHVSAPGQWDNAPLIYFGIRHSESEKLLQQTVETSSITGNKRASVGVVNSSAMMSNYVYPSMDQLAEMLLQVFNRFRLRSVIGFGVGAGANILARFGLNHPEKVDGLVLINCTAKQAGWVEWGYQKWNTWYLRSGQLTAAVEDYLLWHWFGQKTDTIDGGLLLTYLDYARSLRPQNLGHFIESYVRRTDLGIVREVDATKKDTVKNFKCPVMLVVGQSSAHVNDTIDMNSKLDPKNSTWVKFDCSGSVLEQVPFKMYEAFLFYLQGLGYVPTLRVMKPSASAGAHPHKTSSCYQMNSVAEALC